MRARDGLLLLHLFLPEELLLTGRPCHNNGNESNGHHSSVLQTWTQVSSEAGKQLVPNKKVQSRSCCHWLERLKPRSLYCLFWHERI
jgi:hypothetical protein